MFTNKRLPLVKPKDLGDMWRVLSEYLLSLEQPNALSIVEKTEWTPTVTASANTITTATASGERYLLPGGLKFFTAEISITTNGTGSGVVQFTLPETATANGTGWGRAENVSGYQLQTRVLATSSTAIVANFDGTYPGADGELLIVAGFYV